MPIQNFCHQCNRYVRLRDTDLICADCGGDFIEQREVPFPELDMSMESDAGSDDRDERGILETHFLNHPRMPAVPPQQPPLPQGRVGLPGGIAEFFNFMNPHPPPPPPRSQQQPHHHHHLPPHQHARIQIHVEPNDPGTAGGANAQMLGMLQGLVQRFAGPAGGAPNVNFQIHVGPDGRNLGGATVQFGDYVIGNNMDQLLNELMQQFGDGAPQQGITEEQLKLLPIVKVQQAHVDNKTQCSTCFEDYVLDEEVAQLKCSHIFHPDCVKPWLATHNTCPVCRNVVDPKDWGAPDAGASGDDTPTTTQVPQRRPSTSSNVPGFVEDELD